MRVLFSSLNPGMPRSVIASLQQVSYLQTDVLFLIRRQIEFNIFSGPSVATFQLYVLKKKGLKNSVFSCS